VYLRGFREHCTVRANVTNLFLELTLNDSYVYLNFDPAEDWKMRESAQAAAEKIIEVIDAHVNTVCQSFPWGHQF
jgi:hypothetical protein